MKHEHGVEMYQVPQTSIGDTSLPQTSIGDTSVPQTSIGDTSLPVADGDGSHMPPAWQKLHDEARRNRVMTSLGLNEVDELLELLELTEYSQRFQDEEFKTVDDIAEMDVNDLVAHIGMKRGSAIHLARHLRERAAHAAQQ